MTMTNKLWSVESDNIMYNDTRSKYDRIGYSNLFKSIRNAVAVAGIFTILLMTMAICFISKATAEVNYKASIKTIIYENTRHR